MITKKQALEVKLKQILNYLISQDLIEKEEIQFMKNLTTKMTVILATVLAAGTAFAQEATTVATEAGKGEKGTMALAAALAIGGAAFGGALAQGKTAASALDGIARNPAASGKIFTPMIVGLALIESLVIYALVIAFKLT